MSAAWRLSSVHWLQQNVKSCEYIGRGMPAPAALATMLKRIRYSEDDFIRFTKSKDIVSTGDTFDKWIEELVSRWEESDHRSLIEWCKKEPRGGRRPKPADLKPVPLKREPDREEIKGDHPDMEPVVVVESDKVAKVPRRSRKSKSSPLVEDGGSGEGLEADDLEDAIMYGSSVAGSW